MKYGCIGERLGHSFSREIHQALSAAPYELCELKREELPAFLKRGEFLGINVTIPYKQEVLPYLSQISEEAQKIGAVNTVIQREGRLYGYNTDFYGLWALLLRIGVPLEGKKVAILGTGGTARTAYAVASSLGAGEILKVSRTPGEDAVTYEELLRLHSDVQYLINTTPLGMYPDLDGIPVDPRCFPDLCGVADVVYNPLRTRLVLETRALGIPSEGGLFMLVAQAVRASELFHSCEYPMGTVERVFDEIHQSKENIVLIGMPGAGKTTVGRLLSQQLIRELIDTDERICDVAKKEIREIFEEDGESAFREIESGVIAQQVAPLRGSIVSTGGGAILREENLRHLRQNGRLYFIDRPVEALLPTPDRPLALSKEAILQRYRERYVRYCAAADRRIEARDDASKVADRIRKDFEHI